MITFLFWNVARQDRLEILSNLVSIHNVDILLLVESISENASILKTLNPQGKNDFFYVPNINCDKVQIFSRFHNSLLQTIYDEHRLTIRHLKLPGRDDLLLAVTHFQSKLNWSDTSQAAHCIHLANTIRETEQLVNHSRTILVGDMNMNPFEQGVISAHGLHAVMTRVLAKKGHRIIDDQKYPFFYNPMWTLLGDANPDLPSGTFYNWRSEPNVYFWNMFDQVFVRPDLLDYFEPADLQIISSDGKTSFVNSEGIPDVNIASDHLPILFRLRF